MYTLRLATEADAEAVNALRKLCYGAAVAFDLKDSAVLDVASDPKNSFVLCLWDGDELAGCVRLTYCASEAEAIHVLDAGNDLGGVTYPTLAVCRAASHPNYRGFGILPMFCEQAVHLARELGASCLCAVRVDGTPGRSALVEFGWTLRRLAPAEVTFMTPKAPTDLGVISAAAFDTCIRNSQVKYASAWAQVTIERSADARLAA
jgi:GNAT superfamily N-acetyltransferase